jgi:hypothetical protein
LKKSSLFPAEKLSKNQSSSTSKLSNKQKKKERIFSQNDATPEASKEDGKKNVQVKNAKAVVITIS